MNVWNQLHHPDRLFAVIVIALSVLMYVLTGEMAPPDSAGAISASTYPRIVLIFIIILSIALVVRPVSGESRGGPLVLRGLPVIFLSALYIALVEPVGFFLITPVFLFVLPLLAGFRNYRLTAISVFVITALLYGVFVETLAIPLPTGLLGD